MSSILVPDAIEPYYGLKTLRLVRGLLYSPQRQTPWPPQSKLSATCSLGTLFDRTLWMPLRPQDPIPPEAFYLLKSPPRVGTNVYTNGSTITHVSFGEPSGREAWSLPQLPVGYDRWAAVDSASRHQPVDEQCSCGIYLADQIFALTPFFDSDSVIVEVAGWGRVVRGSKGARVQHAYPQKLFYPHHLTEAGIAAAERYGIPSEPLQAKYDRRFFAHYFKPDAQTLKRLRREDALLSSYAFSLAAVVAGACSSVAAFGNAPSWISWTLSGLAVLSIGIAWFACWDARR